MATKRRPPLGVALARLIVEYPETDWKTLSERLRNREFMEELAEAVDGISKLATKSGGKQKTKRPTSRRSVFARISEEDPEKAKILTALRSRLTDKVRPPPLSQIRSLAVAIGMKDHISSRREQAVNQIIRHLVDKTVEEIKTKLHKEIPGQRDLGSEYNRWVDLILGARNQNH